MKFFWHIISLITVYMFCVQICLSAQDTIKLKAAVVIGEKSVHNQPTTRVTILDTAILNNYRDRSLAEVLSENSVIHIKSLGQGALATASFRGTSSSHTQVSWNGIVINSPLMESFDFSQIPVFFTDDVQISHGAGSGKYGSGALGGNVNFSNNKNDSSYLKILSEYGSCNTYTEGIGLNKQLGKLILNTRAFYQSSDNDFKYLNKVYSKEQFYERRINADYSKFGIMQEAYYTFNPANMLTTIFWWQMDSRNLPQPIIVDQSAKESQINREYRALVKYSHQSKSSIFSISTAFLHDNLDYSKKFDEGIGNSKTNSNSNSLIINSSYNNTINANLSAGINATFKYENVDSENYLNSNINRKTFSFNMFAKYLFWKRAEAILNASCETIGESPAYTYSAGINYTFTDWLKLKLQNSYNHKFPSLNDLYWEPGGNPDLKAEKGFSYEATAAISNSVWIFSINTDITYYRMNIDNWIMWIPTGNGYYWEPQNFRNVLSQGAELKLSTQFKIGIFDNRIVFNYAYTSSVDKSKRDDGTNNCQLPYIPANKWNINYKLKYKALGFYYSSGFTDVRYTTADLSYYTNAYTIHNAEVSYNFTLKKIGKFSAYIKINNIFNDYYESTQYYPMPLRSFTAGVIWTLK